MNKDKVTKLITWLIIILLAILCHYFWGESKSSKESVVSNAQYSKNESQEVVMSESETLNELKKENGELYDSIRNLSDVASAIQIKYVTVYKTDTVRFGADNVPRDSIYEYSRETDTVSYDLKIKGKDVEWFDLDISLQDSLMLVTRSKNDFNETVITHTSYTGVTDATIYVPKQSFIENVKSKLYIGVGVGAGYGIINNKPDIYVGINAGMKF